jgi:hypothetical protein
VISEQPANQSPDKQQRLDRLNVFVAAPFSDNRYRTMRLAILMAAPTNMAAAIVIGLTVSRRRYSEK